MASRGLRLALVTITVAATGACAVSCSGYESRETISRWLTSRTGPTSVSVAGPWKSSVWGTTYFKQRGSDVRGQLGEYAIFGRLKGRTLSLTLWHGGEMYYTATLTLDRPDVLLGRYYRTTRQQEGWTMMLRRKR